MSTRPGFWLALVGYVAVPLCTLLVVARGNEADMAWLLALVLVALISMIALAAQPLGTARQIGLALALTGIQVAFLWGAMMGGRKIFAWEVVKRLDEYRAVADVELTRLANASKRYDRRDNPHPEIAWVDATTFSDGGSLVRLALQRAPRTLVLLLPSKHKLPSFDETGRCLERVSGDWQWYVRC